MDIAGPSIAKKIRYRRLDSKVIAVAVEGSVGDWAAYIGAVPGINHDEEWITVKEDGTKLPKTVAEAMFPEFKTLTWRY